ncbi:LysR substrate-binding domain-containing protein [Arthrobacter sp. GMC3]|uniref:LysR substrate-binding domain-containing protein n=1 Tax=Arthrobacter sp. GMC3 TaxID=2058894 RepID=UPI000CE3AC16|nr:LysR substrate-binding domain-containing protein [Arthrobacter sp. GMC3]
MNLTRLRAFHLVATHGGYTAAAQAAGLRQPTLSEHVRLLESEYGLALLRREGHAMELTSAGEALMVIATKLFAAESEAQDLLGSGGLLRGHLRFGTDAPIHAVPILTALRTNYPGISIRIITGNSASIKKAVINGSLDLGIVAEGPPGPDLAYTALSSHDLVAVVHSDSRYALLKKLNLTALRDAPIIVRELGSVTRLATESALASYGVTPGHITEADSREAVHAAVLAGLGIGLVAEDEFSHDPRLVLLDFMQALPPLTEYLVHRSDRAGESIVAAVVGCVPGW